MPLLKLIRWPNLLTIILSEIIVKYALMDYFFAEVGLSYRLDNFTFIVLVISSIFIAAAGNIINDITDIESDKINNHLSRPLVNEKISLKQANILFYLFSFLGIGFSIYAGILVGDIALFAFQLIVFIILFLYSKQLKCKRLIGNIIVSTSTALVPILIWFYTINDVSNQGIMFNFSLRWMHFSVMFFALFAFLSNLIRELIKDREDSAADIAVDCKTWAGEVSLEKFRKATYYLIFILIILILLFQILSPQSIIFRLSLIPAQLVLIIFVLPKLAKSTQKEDFHSLSSRMKIVMIVGVITPILLWL